MVKTLADSGLVAYEPYSGVSYTSPAASWPRTSCGGTG